MAIKMEGTRRTAFGRFGEAMLVRVGWAREPVRKKYAFSLGSCGQRRLVAGTVHQQHPQPLAKPC